MPNLAAAILGKIFCHAAEDHSSWHEGGDQIRGRPTQVGDTTMKLQKMENLNILNQYSPVLDLIQESFWIWFIEKVQFRRQLLHKILVRKSSKGALNLA